MPYRIACPTSRPGAACTSKYGCSCVIHQDTGRTVRWRFSPFGPSSPLGRVDTVTSIESARRAACRNTIRMSFSVRCSSTSVDTNRSKCSSISARVMQSPRTLRRTGMRANATSDTSTAVTSFPMRSRCWDSAPVPAPNSMMRSPFSWMSRRWNSARPSLTPYCGCWLKQKSWSCLYGYEAPYKVTPGSASSASSSLAACTVWNAGSGRQ
jgi:hypothetical protein